MLLKEDSKHHEDQQKYEKIQQFVLGFKYWSTGEVGIVANCGMILWMVAKSCITLYG